VQCHLGIADVNGAGTCLFLDNDIARGKEEANLVNDYFKGIGDWEGAFHGYKMKEKIVVEGRTYGLYSYQYTRSTLTGAELAAFMQVQDHCLWNPAKGAVTGNIRVKVQYYPGTHAMDFIYSDADIIKHCDMGNRTTCVPCDTGEPAPWCSYYSWKDKPASWFFTDASHSDLETTRQQHADMKGSCNQYNGMKL
jgi:hypothetical protein